MRRDLSARASRTAANCLLTLLLCSAVPAHAATQLALPPSPSLPFSWGNFLAGIQLSQVTVNTYSQPDGSNGGSVATLNTHALDANPHPLVTDTLINGKVDLGTVNLQSVLWSGSAPGALTPNRFGAAFLAGFNPTNAAAAGMNFSFLQIYHDASNLTGAIDGGGYRGKTNADIIGYNADPGWTDANSKFNYFDVPFDTPSFVNETVAFEAALVAYNATTVQLLNDFTWSFTTGANGNPQSFLTGTPITEQSAASASLLGLYSNAHPEIAYVQIGAGSVSSLPEPTCLGLAAISFAFLLHRRSPLRTCHRTASFSDRLP